MKKALLSLAFVGAIATGANAQLEVGSVAPDFTLTDIEGNEHHLYDYLEQGYTVLIDISAAWCGPCWSAHESGFMKDLYNQYGPEGTVEAGKVMVIFVEGESANTEAQLHGTSSGSSTATYSQGDWVTGEPYPFIDSDELNDAYNLGGFPTFTLICPNRRVALAVAGYGSSMGTAANWLPLIDDCPIPVDGTNIGTIGINTDGIVCAGESTPLSAEIQNLGTTTLTSASVSAKIDGTTVASTTWTGSLAPYASAIVNIGDYTFTTTADVDYEVTTTGDVEAGDNVRAGTTWAMSSDYRTWRLEVKTDNYPGEITWRVKDDGGSTVESHTYTAGPGEGGAGGADAMKEFSYVLYLDATKCYTVEVVDAYGDGLYGVSSAPDTGYIRLKDNTGGMIYNFGAGYGTGYSIIAKTGNTLDVKNVVSVNDTKIYPNPVSDELNISMNLLKNSAVSFSIVNVVGQQVSDVMVKDMISGQNTTSINTANLAPGMYFLNVTTAEGSFQQKFVKK